MCDIQYEEFDNKERIFRELQDMLLEGQTSDHEDDVPEIDEINPNNSCIEEGVPGELKDDQKTEEVSLENNEEKSIENSELQIQPKISDFYTNYSSSWKEKLKYRVLTVAKPTFNIFQSNISDDEIEASKSGDDLNLGEEAVVTKPKKVLVDSACCSYSEEQKSETKKRPIKNVAIESFGTCFESKSNEPITDSKDMKSMSTETDLQTTSEVMKKESHFTMQADEIFNSLEEKILPFVRNANTVELKLKGHLSVFQRACVKEIAKQQKLMMKHFGKGKDGYILLRKKVEMLAEQKLFLEMKRAEKEKQVEKLKELKEKQARLLNPPKKVSTGCQVDLTDEDEDMEKDPLSKRAARRNRKKQWELKQKQLAKRSSACQTVDEGYYICPYCEDDIPECLQAHHYPHCLERYRSKLQISSLNKEKTDTKQSISTSSAVFTNRKSRSKSREKIIISKLEEVKKELAKVHDKDINSIVNIVSELDRKCAISGCSKKKKKMCNQCMEGYCNEHFSPEGDSSGIHFKCPVISEKIEIEKQKKLGTNNPLLKTVEQLYSPKFKDGSLVNSRKRVIKIVEPDAIPENLEQSNCGVLLSPAPNKVNHTRTRIGPLLGYERSILQKRLHDKIGRMADRRSK